MADGATSQMLLKRTVPARNDKPASLEILLMDSPRPSPQADEVLVRIGASPINPSDLGGMLLGGDRLDEAVPWTHEGTRGLSIPLPEHFQILEEGEWQPFGGNEGAGVVEEAGSNAKHLLGKTVFFQGNTYNQVTVRHMDSVQVQPDGVTAKQAASSFVNPMTVLGMLEKMRREGHTAMVHTAAASQLGRMLVRLCLEEKVPLVNIVRRPEQVTLLKAMGAEHVVDSSSGTFREDLVQALTETGATVAFDALGGGSVASMILECMEAAAWARGVQPSCYGSSAWKQVWTYGRLESSPMELSGSYGGYRWNLGGYLLPDFLETVPPEWMKAAQARIAGGLDSVFKTDYCKELSLEQLLEPENLKLANAKRTDAKVLVVP